MTIHVELRFRTESYAGQAWHRCSVYWRGRAMFGTGLYRDAAGARSDAMLYVNVLRAHVIPDALDIVDGASARRVAWRSFAADNPDVVDDVLEQFRAKGEAYLGGGAAPLVRIMPAA